MKSKIAPAINPALLRAARAALNWSGKELADKSGVAYPTIQRLESGESESPNPRTVSSIISVLNNAGVFFTETGIDIRKIFHRELVGENYFLEVLDDVYETLIDKKDAELLSFGSDDRQNTPEITARLRRIRQAGIQTRDLIEEGNTFMLAPTKCYRCIPKRFFENQVKMVYGDKVFIDFGTSGLLINSADNAAVERDTFNLIWESLPEITAESTANERF